MSPHSSPFSTNSGSSSTPIAQGIEKSDIWFEDGDVIIYVWDEIARERHLFCVHRSILAVHSETFRTTFSLPQHTDTSPLSIFYGKPTLRLYDSPEDVYRLLQAIYLPRHFMLPKYDNETDLVVGSVLRLAIKYEMDGLRDRIMDHFARNWPVKLHELDRRNAEVWRILSLSHEQSTKEPSQDSSTSPMSLGLSSPLGPDPSGLSDPVQTILLARSCNFDEILPSAFYEILRLPWKDLEEEPRLTRNPSAWEKKSNVDRGVLCNSRQERIVDPYLLSPDDLLLLFQSKERMAHRVRQLLSKSTWRSFEAVSACRSAPVTPDESLVESCETGMRQFRATRVVPLMVSPSGSADPLTALQTITEERMACYGICEVCEDDARRMLRATREKWWTRFVDDVLKPQ